MHQYILAHTTLYEIFNYMVNNMPDKSGKLCEWLHNGIIPRQSIYETSGNDFPWNPISSTLVRSPLKPRILKPVQNAPKGHYLEYHPDKKRTRTFWK